MPEEGYTWINRSELLSYEELTQIVYSFSLLGIQKVRLTGGEPTIRKDICELIESLNSINGISEIAMTSNAYFLPTLAQPLKDAGLQQINISLDSLDPERAKKLSRGAQLSRILHGIEAAHHAGLKLKLNSVLIKDENTDEIPELIAYAATVNAELRFIEYMPFEERWHKSLTADELINQLEAHYHLTPLPSPPHSGPARRYRVEETQQIIGFISPLSQKFCSSCNRLRLSAKGDLRSCLAHEDAPSLKALLRQGATEEDLRIAIYHQVLGKPEGHGCTVDGGNNFEGVMTAIGG